MMREEANTPMVKDATLEYTKFPLKIMRSNNESKFCHVPFQTATKTIVTINWQNAKSYAAIESEFEYNTDHD